MALHVGSPTAQAGDLHLPAHHTGHRLAFSRSRGVAVGRAAAAELRRAGTVVETVKRL
ncbi:hypothetical protein [Saccharopolyspora hattusasensis]|uniref:hypothetical protein n=1 Tax=Saccharopolyspora hattusasensis TaxID=1128679 RepID=UPI003D98D772